MKIQNATFINLKCIDLKFKMYPSRYSSYMSFLLNQILILTQDSWVEIFNLILNWKFYLDFKFAQKSSICFHSSIIWTRKVQTSLVQLYFGSISRKGLTFFIANVLWHSFKNNFMALWIRIIVSVFTKFDIIISNLK